jgi:anti-anti-sigma regulatory factor
MKLNSNACYNVRAKLGTLCQWDDSSLDEQINIDREKGYMTVRKRPVAVMQLPERLGKREARIFARQVERCMNVTRPYLVLDCSNVRHLDKSVVYLLLACLEEALKRNGDVKLVGLPLATDAILGSTGTNQLFEIFDTTTEAVDSFHPFSLDDVSETDKSESAA